MAIDGGLVVAGNEVAGYAEVPILTPPLKVVDVTSGTAIEPPTGDFHFAFPAVAYGQGGRLHLFWGELSAERRPVTYHDWTAGPIQEVWHSRRDPGTGWSEPVRLYEAHQIFWAGRSRAMVVDSLRRVHLMFGAQPRFSRSGAVHMRIERDSVAITEVPLPNGPAVYAGLANSGTAGLVAAVIGPPDRRPASNSIHLLQSPDGAAWGPPAHVANVTGGAATDLTVLSRSPGDLALLWGQSRHGGAFADAIVHRHLSSGTTSVVAEFDGIIHHIASAVDRCGAVHIGFIHFDGQGSYARWNPHEKAGLQMVMALDGEGIALDLHGDAIHFLAVGQRERGPEMVTLFEFGLDE